MIYLDVLLINPPWNILSPHNIWKNIGSCLPSLGLAYVAAFLERRGYKVKIIDCIAEKYDLPALKNALRELPAPKFLGLTATTPLIVNALKIAQAAKDCFPATGIILGGVHPTVLPDEVLSHPAVDMVARGEGEETMLEIVEGKPLSKIAGLSYKEGRKVHHNPDRPLIADLNRIPSPAYHLLPMKKYYPALGSYKRLPAMSIFATRGCPGRCTFCYRTFYGKTRKRSAENIVEEVELLNRKYGIREIAFYDDSFTVFRDVVFRFCELLKKRKIDVTWSCFTRADLISKDLLSAMKKAGCHLILFGVESADENVLRNINKKISLDRVVESVRFAREIGIDTRASFLLGSPGETEASIKKTIDFAFKLDPDQLHFNITTAYPGTELYKWAKENGYLLDVDWDNFNMSDINLRLPTISQERLKYYYNWVHRRFYCSPRVILRRLLKVRTFTQGMEELKGFLAILNVFRQN